ncbi:ABC transporter substrate-binding protein [Microbacterium capsulatum]|uniref:ABC transporter substrate-binding protein n=1 Tax=Microbacterium capsulatum TaxID=3041921 RepID=A0ABU0XHE3_9MICO|nr:ABC transporter substrate-binding protein [Microbacterium sp. ASV81]MDQ4214541.1 ABC transporter substrate-binding protein [Microbacterium sp. ASV81]
MSSPQRILKRLALVGVGIVSVAALAACSPPSTGSAGGGAGGASADLTVAETTAPSSLDPQASSLFADRFAWQLSYECLMTTTADGQLKPSLATGYQKSSDGLTYTFTLRDGVKFSNGSTFTADDVVYTFTRITSSPNRIDKELFSTFTSVEKVDAKTVKFHLSSPDAGFVNNMGNPLVWGCAIMSKDAAKENLATKMVGTGPWSQTDYQPETSLTFTRNADYWGDKAKAAKLTVLYMPTMGTQVSNLKAKKVDIIFPDQGSAKDLKSAGFTVDQVHTDSTIFLQINNTKAPFDNPKVAQAMALAFDRKALADQAYGGAARPSAYLPPSLAWAPKLSDVPNHTQDVAKAKQLLADAGYPNGLDISLLYINGYDPGTNDLMAVMQAQLAKAGFKVQLEPLEAATWSARRKALNYQLSWNAQSYYSNPYQYVAPVAGRQGPVPDSLQKLINAAFAAGSETDYQKALSKVEMQEATLIYPTITLLAKDMFVAHASSLQGVKVPSSQSRTFLSQVSK